MANRKQRRAHKRRLHRGTLKTVRRRNSPVWRDNRQHPGQNPSRVCAQTTMAITNRMVKFNLTRKCAATPEAGSVIGRMLLRRRITPLQHSCAFKWLVCYRMFQRACMSPKIQSNSDIRISTSTTPECFELESRWFSQYIEARNIAGKAHPLALMALSRMVEEDEYHDHLTIPLIAGLDALSRHWWLA